ncbi:MAG: DUF1080 domain-containing protein [Verrucomicrobiota bacterium]
MRKILIFVTLLFSSSLFADDWESLLDPELSKFEIWMGVPHATVVGLPEGTYQSDNVHKGTPMGLDNDVKGVFTIVEEGDELILRVSGEIYGGITTLEDYANYHLRMKVRWGEKKWEPRLNAKRDSGLLYNCYGEHGKFWQVWKACMEFQIQETDFGDFIPLGGVKAFVRGKNLEKRQLYDPEAEEYVNAYYVTKSHDAEKPYGEWNQLDLYVIGNDAVHVVNGEIVMVIEDATKQDGTPLVSGQIQLQSEAAEIDYKDIELKNIDAFPPAIAEKVRFRSDSN